MIERSHMAFSRGPNGSPCGAIALKLGSTPGAALFGGYMYAGSMAYRCSCRHTRCPVQVATGRRRADPDDHLPPPKPRFKACVHTNIASAQAVPSCHAVHIHFSCTASSSFRITTVSSTPVARIMYLSFLLDPCSLPARVALAEHAHLRVSRPVVLKQPQAEIINAYGDLCHYYHWQRLTLKPCWATPYASLVVPGSNR